MPRQPRKIFELNLKSVPKEISKVENFLRKIDKEYPLEELHFHNLLVATTEAVNNSIIHGNLRDPKKKVIVTCRIFSSFIEIQVADEGKGISEADIPNPLDENNLLRENGRGIFLIREFMEKVMFKKTKSGGVVVMRSKIKSGQKSDLIS